MQGDIGQVEGGRNVTRKHGTGGLARTALAVAMALALGLPQAGMAQSAREAELEQRVAELERLVSELVNRQHEASTKTEAVAAELDKVKAAPKVQVAPILASGANFSYGGFVKLDAMITDTSDGRIAEGSAGRQFYVPSTIPVGGPGADGGDPYTDIHAQFSRIWFAADATTEAGNKFRGYIEADLFGGGSSNLGNEVSTNTHALTMRQAFVTWNGWLAGQTWSNFQDVAALPDAVDFVGPTEGTIFVRQAQVRYTTGPWSFSLENPHTTVSSVANAARNNSGGDNVLPDVTARYMMKGDWGHFTVAGLLRQLKVGEESDSAAALSVSGRYVLGSSDDLRYMASYGGGLGRYLGFGLGADAEQDVNGDLHAQNAWGGFVGWRHAFSPKLRSNLMYSFAEIDNDKNLAGFGPASLGATERAYSYHANLIYTPFPRLDIGAEVTFGVRELEDDRKGDLTRFHTTVKYSF